MQQAHCHFLQQHIETLCRAYTISQRSGLTITQSYWHIMTLWGYHIVMLHCRHTVTPCNRHSATCRWLIAM